MKKLYHVTIENDFYCIAEDSHDAEQLHRDAMDDFFEWSVNACEVKDKKWIPHEWLDGLTYGAEEDIKLKDWIAKREQEEMEAKKKAELDALQLKLPL